MEYTTIIDLAKDVKTEINKYNSAEPARKHEALLELKSYINTLLSSEQNRSLIYRGSGMSTVFCKTLGQWRMRIWKSITNDKKED